ncbi:MAG: tRNA preQ1(34) S-adenosylmethionine ribosyltransferase-isomerase QueA [Acholeplasmataceae bacterium]|jgi:S-adenosylmethionine:tRNA ribosyltransferase-isomerase|nr:tRNA preQ1(34) S-adenosylmethionine ribosyltransferase-isomerase QueA [Acholeplasmataceae bacterium]
MKTQEFDYPLPQEKIAQHPTDKRDHSKLMIMDRKTGMIEHHLFYQVLAEFTENDCLIINNSKVIPARLIGEKQDTGGVVELLLLENENNLWQCLTKPAKRVKKNQIISFGDGLLKARCLENLGEGIILYEMIYQGIFLEVLEQLGQMPLPPYIYEKLVDKERYQTVYAKNPGSVAAPTAGFHFTKELLTKIKSLGVEIIEITLHVGLGTFRPILEEDIANHKMHCERYYISENVKNKLNAALKNKKRMIAVGTTVVRALESNFNGGFKAGFFTTDIFIYPNYKFKVIDALITNFHLPKSTLLLLVSAFSTKEHILKAYQEAILKDYRFFSFGDAMFLK